MHNDRWLDVLFGMGDDDFPFWLMAVRSNILIFVICSAVVVVWAVRRNRCWRRESGRREILIVSAITLLAAVFRFGAATNLLDFGGIPYSRLLVGYKGHFGTAQFYAPFYQLSWRDIEHAIAFNRVVGVLTVPLVYGFCRSFLRGPFPAVSALLFAVSPLHILFSASDALAVFSVFLTAASYVLIGFDSGTGEEDCEAIERLRYLAGFSGLALLTQVRYENVLFAAPALGLILLRRERLRWRIVAAPLAATLLLVVGYGYWGTTAGLSFQNPVRLSSALVMVAEHVVANPFVAVPALALGSLVGSWFGGWWVGLLAIGSWLAALGLPLLSESGHGASRVFASWLVLLIPLASFALTRLLGSERLLPRLAGWAGLAYFALQPLVVSDRLTTQHIEILEHEFYRSQLASLPAAVTHIIVPDDVLLRRRTHSTIELQNKYAMTLAGVRELGGRVKLVNLTAFLEGGHTEVCAQGRCAFFYGLPCLEQRVYPYTREQCMRLLAEREVSVLAQREVIAAPFMDCSIYVGEMRRRICEPATRRQRFVMYQIGRDSGLAQDEADDANSDKRGRRGGVEQHAVDR